MDKYVPDTSVIIEEILSTEARAGTLKGTILIPNAVVAELEHQANMGQETGLIGLKEVKILRELSEKGLIGLEFIGERPSAEQIKYAKKGEIDALIRKHAFDAGAVLVTADLVQAASAEAFGIKTKYYDFRKAKKELIIKKYFTPETMSVHLKEGVEPFAKIGLPGAWKYTKISEEKLSRKNIEEIADNIQEIARIDDKSFIEINRKGSTIAQIREYRIVITKMPFSAGTEITAVRPIKEMSLTEYNLPEKLIARLDREANGIIICGTPGAGKTTFAEAIAKYYHKKGCVIKTIESPRDLQLGPEITQYNKNMAKASELHDILLLSRPDYTIFDEVRDTKDFKLYADLRLAGIGMLGVMHGASAMDTIQRFIGRLELGMLPSIIDTVIFISKGLIEKVYSLKMKVKVPTGMYESDLSRPVIEVRDFSNDELDYEIYTYGEQTVVMPVNLRKLTKINPETNLKNELEQLFRKSEVDVQDNKAIVRVPRSQIKTLLRIRGDKIRKLEKKYGINIELYKR